MSTGVKGMLGVGILVLVVAAGIALRGGSNGIRSDVYIPGGGSTRSGGHGEPTGTVPQGLRLPFSLSDVDVQNGVVNPLGVVRFSKDQGEFGHSGIDMPLHQGAPVVAAANGEIVLIKTAGDPWGGQGIFHLLETTRPGEGWTYVYEHVTPRAGLKTGDKVRAGEVIATKTPPKGFTAHFQLSYTFNDHEYTRGMECWVDSLSSSEKQKFLSWWQQYSTGSVLQSAWRTTSEEGKYPFRGLLDPAKYPKGPQLCYTPGTDVR